ncbi:MAG: hypothetical protein NTX04_09695, partial [Verrucomicrobia bacterium]|nr:hypothetical protein [Verrucomicrobiota bacterium]
LPKSSKTIPPSHHIIKKQKPYSINGREKCFDHPDPVVMIQRSSCHRAIVPVCESVVTGGIMPSSVSVWMSLARIRAQLGKRAATLEAVARVTALDASNRLQMLGDPLLASVW